MKDIKGIEIKPGQTVHIYIAAQGIYENTDALATVARSRGRGIKFVCDTGHEFTPEELEQCHARIVVHEQVKAPEFPSSIQSEEITLVNKLKSLGWTGSLSKSFGSINIRIDM